MAQAKVHYPRPIPWSPAVDNSDNFGKQDVSMSHSNKSNIRNNEITREKRRKPRTRLKRAGLWTTCPCCTSLSSFLFLLLGCIIAAGLALTVALPILLIPSGTTSTTTESTGTSANTTIDSSTTGSTISTTATTTVSTISSISTTTITTTTSATSATTSITVTSTTTTKTSTTTTATTTSTSSTSTTTINTCIASFTKSTQLLFLNTTDNYWTQYTFNYTAPNVTNVTLMFSFRNDPSFWYLDAITVTNRSSGSNLISNGEFNTGDLSYWTYCNPKNATYSGYVSSTIYYNGPYGYADGSVGAFDYLSQRFRVVPYNWYIIKFWLASLGTNNTYASITISY